jgi:hypothetical protein
LSFFHLHDLRIRAISSTMSFSTFLKLLPKSPTFFDRLRPFLTFLDLRFRRIQSISSPALLPPARTSATLPDVIRTESTLFDLLRLSTWRDSGDLRVSTGRLLHRVGQIGYAVPQDVRECDRWG